MKKRLSLVLLNILLCFSALAVLCGYIATVKAEEPKYTVKFWLDEGKNTEYAVARQTVNSGDCAVVPVTPTKEGNFFLYWKLGADKFSFKTPITENIDLTAEWLTPDEGVTVTEMFNVKFIVDGTVVNEQNVEKGKDAIAPTGFSLPEGRLFLNWDRTFTDVQEDIVVTANLTAAEYTVKVIGFNDVEITTISGVQYGDPVDTSAIVIPSVANYHVDESNKFLGNTYCITSDSEIYVNYIPNEYTATFKVGENVYGEVQTLSYGEYVGCPAIPEKQGYIFKGWYIESDEETQFDFNTLIESSVTLFAKYQIIENKKYDVTFYNYDGVQYGAVQSVEEGKTAIPAGRPAREGYDFLGWYVIGDTRELYDFDSPVTEDITLNAVFKIKEYTITVINDGEVISTQKVKYGGNAIEPQVEVKEGYIFTGFDASFKDIRKDTTINATFRLKTFAVMFIDAYGKKMCATQYVEYGKSAKVPQVPELEGYVFLQWSENYEEIKDDVSIIPLYAKIIYEFIYMLGDETYDTKTVEYGHTAISLVPTKDGYIFRGWFTDESCEETYAYDFTKEIKEANGTVFVLYGAFDLKPSEQFTVTFTVDGAIFAMYSVEYGKNCPTPNMPNKYGYIFKGWDGEYSNVTEDLVIAANFEKMTFTVRPTGFMGAGEEHSFKVEYGTYLTDEMFPENVPEREGYTFIGWNYDATIPVTQDIQVFAGYTINVYTVTFIVEGEEYDVQDVNYNSHASVPNQPYIEGKTFEGWYVKDTENKFDFRSGVKADVTVVATFSKVVRKIYYYLDNQPYGEPQSIEVGAQITKLSDPELPAHTDFFGWNGLPEDMVMPNYNVNVYGNTRTHYAYTIKYYINGTVYFTDTVYDGDAVTKKVAPSAEDLERITDADTLFIKWDNEPEIMPSYDVRVNAVLKKYYYATFSIAGYYRNLVRLLQGDAVPKMGAPELPNVPGYVFTGWDYNGFDVMPEHDIVIIGGLMRNYTVRYYVNGELYRTVEVFQGDAVTPLAIPEGYEDFVVDGWDNEPETMPTEDVRVDAVIRLKYTITYYIDDDVCATVKIAVGDDIPEFTPETDETTTRFVAWINLPTDGKMPAENLNIYSQVKHRYTLTYKINDEVYMTVILWEGERIDLIEYTGTLEGMVFVEWNKTDVRETMPAGNYTINAVLRTLNKYSITYYAYGEEFARFEVYEGYAIPSLEEVPELAYDNERFFGWINLPENGVMPNRDVVVYADIRGEYKLTYIVDDEIYFEDTILQGTPIMMLEYRGTREDIEFIAWDRTITEMPSYDFVITASIRKFEKHTITYYINNEIFDTREYYATKPVTPYGTPKLKDENEIFDGWTNEPDTMPNYDIDVYGYSHVKEEDQQLNRFILETAFEDDKELTLTFMITEEVRVGGFVGSVSFNAVAVKDCRIDLVAGDNIVASRVGDEIRFAWANFENATQETVFLTITFERAISALEIMPTLNVFNVYAFDELGDAVPVEYEIN